MLLLLLLVSRGSERIRSNQRNLWGEKGPSSSSKQLRPLLCGKRSSYSLKKNSPATASCITPASLSGYLDRNHPPAAPQSFVHAAGFAVPAAARQDGCRVTCPCLNKHKDSCGKTTSPGNFIESHKQWGGIHPSICPSSVTCIWQRISGWYNPSAEANNLFRAYSQAKRTWKPAGSYL